MINKTKYHVDKVTDNAEHIMKVPISLLMDADFIISLALSVKDRETVKNYIRDAFKQCPIINLKLFDTICKLNLN